MTALVDKKLIRRRFSDAACCYRDLADIQTRIAGELVARAKMVSGMRVLDVGAGDGAVAEALVLSGTEVLALDGAWGMVSRGRGRAPKALWLQADAAFLPFAARKFDGVISSSAYQWVDDLPAAFCEVRRVLKPGGRFMAAMFGHGTLDELFVSMDWAAHASARALPALRRLPSEDDVRSALHKAGFKDPGIDVEKRRVQFQDVKAVLAWLKAIGANTSARNFFWGKALLAATEKEYRAHFSDSDRLRATFEVIWIDVGV